MIIEEIGISGGIIFFLLVVGIIYCITYRLLHHAQIRDYDDMRDFLLEAGENEVGHVHEPDEEGGVLEASLDDIFPNVLNTDRDKKKKGPQRRNNDMNAEEERETPEDRASEMSCDLDNDVEAVE